VDSPEQKLQAFLDSLPEWRRKWLRYDPPFDGIWISQQPPYSERLKAARQEMSAWAENLDDDIPIREQYERLLQQIPQSWREYRTKLKRQALSDLTKAKAGRKRETELAERIWELQGEGKTTPEIQMILRTEGKNYSREAIEAYSKTRRKKSQK